MEPLQESIAEKAREGLDANWSEWRVGFCWRYVRQILARAGVKAEDYPPQGVDAAGAFAWFKERGMVRKSLTNSLPGDIIFWVGPGHGRHGHVGFRIYGNMLAENSSYHVSGDDDDARGTRALSQLSGISGVVRINPELTGG